MTVITRFPPSPTGSLHIGGIRSALYCYAFAKKHNGEFILRIEDTDRKRFVTGSIEEAIEMLEAYGLTPTRKPSQSEIDSVNSEKYNFYGSDWILQKEELENINDEDFSNIYTQSLRTPLYQKYALELIEKGFAYISFDEAKKLEETREKNKSEGFKNRIQPKHSKEPYTDETLDKIKAGQEYVIRMDVAAYKNWKKTDFIEHDDRLLGLKKFPLEEVTDQIIIKSDGIPTYHLAVVVDDHLMKVTYPMRSSEWISSTPKQVMIYEMLGWEMPRFTHLTAILDPAGGKLSKRKGTVAAKAFLTEGYLPEAVINFLMFLGWSSPEEKIHGETEQEIYSLEEFVDLFSIEGLNKSNPVFNRDKLLWYNQQYIIGLNPKELMQKFQNWIEEFSKENELEELYKRIISKGSDYLSEALLIEQTRAKTFLELAQGIKTFYFEPENFDFNSIKQIKNLSQEEYIYILSSFLEKLKNFPENSNDWVHADWEAAVREIAEKKNIKGGQAFMSLRFGLTGSAVSPPLFECMQIMGKNEVSRRINLSL
jgi:glutamyl-tRNA synthetase